MFENFSYFSLKTHHFFGGFTSVSCKELGKESFSVKKKLEKRNTRFVYTILSEFEKKLFLRLYNYYEKQFNFQYSTLNSQFSSKNAIDSLDIHFFICYNYVTSSAKKVERRQFFF